MSKINFYKKVNTKSFINDLDLMIDSVYNNINTLIDNTKHNPTYDNFFKPYCVELNKLSSLTFHLGHEIGTKYTDELNELGNIQSDKLNEFYFSKLPISKLYKHIDSMNIDDLPQNIKKKVKDELLGYASMGVNLSTTDKEKLKSVNKDLSKLSSEFSKNVLESVNDYELIIDEHSDVIEFPQIELERFTSTDINNNVTYKFGLDYPSYSAYMKYGNNRNIRMELHKNFVNRGGTENTDIIIDILRLKNEKASILGFNNYSEMSLVDKMLNTPAKVYEFIDTLSTDEVVSNSVDETKVLFDYAKTMGFTSDKLEPYDASYYINLYKVNILTLDSLEVSTYFEKDHTLGLLFDMLDKMFNLDFVHNTNINTWSDDVDVFDVYKDEQLISTVYFDLEARDGKKPGAWMNYSHTGHVNSNDKFEQSVAYVTCNFNKSTDSLPSLLTLSDVNTLFHEMGHVLQHICSGVDDIVFAGIDGIEWDAVEWSSQFMEEFLYDKNVLSDMSSHYLTSEKLPSVLIDKIISNRDYNKFRFLTYQLFLTKFDMDVHNNDIGDVTELREIISNLSSLYGVDKCDYDNFQNSFSHIFSGGYSSAYYSYLWSNVLSIDAFKKFNEAGIFDLDNCDNYYSKFLSLGSSKSSIDMFADYVGTVPNPLVLL